MGIRQRYKKKSNTVVVAVQVNLDTDGFTYLKWGADQRCKQGDWLVDNNGSIYTVDREVFEKTYKNVGLGHYAKVTAIYAEVATESGAVETKEGKTHYKAGDYLVSNNEDGTDAYSITADKFESMYELDE